MSLPARRPTDAHAGEARRYQGGDLRHAWIKGSGGPQKGPRHFEAEMDSCGAKWQMLVSGGLLHSFCEIESNVLGVACYNAGAARQCFTMIDNYLNTAFEGKL